MEASASSSSEMDVEPSELDYLFYESQRAIEELKQTSPSPTQSRVKALNFMKSVFVDLVNYKIKHPTMEQLENDQFFMCMNSIVAEYASQRTSNRYTETDMPDNLFSKGSRIYEETTQTMEYVKKLYEDKIDKSEWYSESPEGKENAVSYNLDLKYTFMIHDPNNEWKRDGIFAKYCKIYNTMAYARKAMEDYVENLNLGKIEEALKEASKVASEDVKKSIETYVNALKSLKENERNALDSFHSKPEKEFAFEDEKTPFYLAFVQIENQTKGNTKSNVLSLLSTATGWTPEIEKAAKSVEKNILESRNIMLTLKMHKITQSIAKKDVKGLKEAFTDPALQALVNNEGPSAKMFIPEDVLRLMKNATMSLSKNGNKIALMVTVYSHLVSFSIPEKYTDVIAYYGKQLKTKWKDGKSYLVFRPKTEKKELKKRLREDQEEEERQRLEAEKKMKAEEKERKHWKEKYKALLDQAALLLADKQQLESSLQSTETVLSTMENASPLKETLTKESNRLKTWIAHLALLQAEVNEMNVILNDLKQAEKDYRTRIQTTPGGIRDLHEVIADKSHQYLDTFMKKGIQIKDLVIIYEEEKKIAEYTKQITENAGKSKTVAELTEKIKESTVKRNKAHSDYRMSYIDFTENRVPPLGELSREELSRITETEIMEKRAIDRLTLEYDQEKDQSRRRLIATKIRETKERKEKLNLQLQRLLIGTSDPVRFIRISIEQAEKYYGNYIKELEAYMKEMRLKMKRTETHVGEINQMKKIYDTKKQELPKLREARQEAIKQHEEMLEHPDDYTDAQTNEAEKKRAKLRKDYMDLKKWIADADNRIAGLERFETELAVQKKEYQELEDRVKELYERRKRDLDDLNSKLKPKAPSGLTSIVDLCRHCGGMKISV